MLHIGVRSFQFKETKSHRFIDKDRLKTWVLPVCEIDYVRVYGEAVDGFRNDTIILNNPQNTRIDSTVLYVLIGVVTIFVIFIIMVIYCFMRKRRLTNNGNYDDIRDVENENDEFNYNYAYEVIHYRNEETDEIYQGHHNEYLVLTDPLAENLYQNQSSEKIIESSEV